MGVTTNNKTDMIKEDKDHRCTSRKGRVDEEEETQCDTQKEYYECKRKNKDTCLNFNMGKCKAWGRVHTFYKDYRLLKKSNRTVTKLRFSKPRQWSWASRTIIIILTILMAPFVADILRNKFSTKYNITENGTMVRSPSGYTSSFASACNPPGSGRTSHPRFLRRMPLVYGQRVPNVSERTIGASGPAEGRIYRTDKNFNDKLKVNWDINVIFKNDEEDKEDRLMTERCRESLKKLAVMVKNEWEGVKVRVTEAWKEEQEIAEDDETILHYEGRALDITTCDLDREKYGLLARFAVTAGFDWVYYKSHNFIHCSCKSDSLDEALYEGCFSGKSMVSTPHGGTIPMSELKVGDEVLAVDKYGHIVPDKILTFMDRKSAAYDDSRDENTYRGDYFKIETDDGHVISMTGNHLIFVGTEQNQTSTSSIPHGSNSKAIFAKHVKAGQYIYVVNNGTNDNSVVQYSKVVSVTAGPGDHGAFAPLTTHGTILVDGIMASCYAVLENHDIAHVVMAPARYYYVIYNWISEFFNKYDNLLQLPSRRTKNCYENDLNTDYGVTWYPKLWFKIGSYILPSSMFQNY